MECDKVHGGLLLKILIQSKLNSSKNIRMIPKLNIENLNPNIIINYMITFFSNIIK